MVYGMSSSTYMNEVGSFYKYGYSNLQSGRSSPKVAPVNTAGQGGAKTGYLNKEVAGYVASIRQNARNMKDSLGSLSNVSTFTKMRAVSSNEDYLQVEKSGKNPPSLKETSMSVTQIAAAQQNEGAAMASGDRYVSSGTRQFEVETGGKNHSFSIDVKPGDTNLDVQNKMVGAINGRNIGVIASVEKNAKKNTSALSVASVHTGRSGAFKIRDVEGSLAAATGISAVTRDAQDAIYRIGGGKAQSSPSNRVAAGNGVEVTLKKATSGDVRVFAAKDTAYARDAVKAVASDYNGMLLLAQGQSRKLSNDLKSAVKAYAPSLERIGISAGQDGTLQIDDKKLGQAAENGDLQNFFTGSAQGGSYGFSGRISQISRNAEWNTPMYLNNSASNVLSMPRSNPYGYGQGSGSALYSNQYRSGAYNSISGYLFDLYA